MLRRIDRSPRISQLLRRVSSTFAARLGLPMLIATGLILLSGACFALTIPLLIIAEQVKAVWLLVCVPILLLHLGLFLGFLGFMLATPLGAEYHGK
ncbi:MAG: hypothetical protein CUN55_05310 [Phototrophicales bacterium]|nr:MAG: hypothetical protein CUN55_05310 [Phototrophicales bacterium]